MNDLHDLHILVTRPALQGTEICRLITDRCGHAIHFPTIAFAPPPDQLAFQQAIALLGEQEWLIFISPQSVYASVDHIRKAWPQWPQQVKFAAVGAGTVKALHEAGYEVSSWPMTDWGSDGLLALPEFQSVFGKKIAIIRGMGGREIVDKVLTARGAYILPVLAYERILPTVDVSECLQLLKQRIINRIVCTSYEGVKNLKILVGETGWPYLKGIPLIVMSERIKTLAHDLGFQTIWVTRHASQTAILDACRKRE